WPLSSSLLGMLANARSRALSFVREFFGNDEEEEQQQRGENGSTSAEIPTSTTTATEASTVPKKPPASCSTASSASLIKPVACRIDSTDRDFDDEDDDGGAGSESKVSAGDLTRRLRHYGNLLAKDCVIRQFLLDDSCLRLADRTLLAIAFVYFIRCRLKLGEYNRNNFFACLWLAHETEEEYDNLRLALLPAWLGRRWTRLLKHAGKARTELWRRMRYRTLVTRSQLAPIMARIERHLPHVAWRERPSPGPHPTALRRHRQPSFSADSESGPNCAWCRRDQRPANRKSAQQKCKNLSQETAEKEDEEEKEVTQQHRRSNIRLRPLRYRSIIDLSPDEEPPQAKQPRRSRRLQH
uniref:Speedy protein A n=2 Tax=Macrostomum lignano TaxID=282301 RepID=A0A1I8G9A2_9PLAT